MAVADHAALRGYGDVFEPSEAAEPILARGVRSALTEWLTEIWAEDELKAVGVGPRKRAIFSGPSGTGKTTLAHHLAARLGLRMLAVRPELIISKYVGETGERIGRLFSLLRANAEAGEPLVLFFDEFDALTRQRRKSEQASDDSRNEEVDTMLQRMEQHDGFLIAATNHANHIDKAIWRRFDMHIVLDLPGQPERERILARYLLPFRLTKAELVALGEACATASPALMRAFSENLKRAIVVGPLLDADMRREATIERVLSAIEPHPDLGRPRLWSLVASDPAVRALRWPMSRELQSEAMTAEAVDAPNVTLFPKRGGV